MRPSTIVPTGVARTFDPDDVIVSKTDLQGRITYVNDVFVDVSRYAEEELLGKPHNLIRHPEMPRAVFALLWEEIGAGRELFAYINNLARDGAHYWVFAHVTPSIVDGRTVGYHSNRRTPDPAALAQVAPLYAAMFAAERRHVHPREALVAGRSVLEATLAERGQTYDEMVWSLSGVAA